jgi:hypothetical protein
MTPLELVLLACFGAMLAINIALTWAINDYAKMTRDLLILVGHRYRGDDE